MPHALGIRLPRKIPIRVFLSILVLTALIPPIVLLALVIVRTSETDRTAAERNLINSAHVIASIVNSSLKSNAATLRSFGDAALASDESSPNLSVIERHFNGVATLTHHMADRFETSEVDWNISNLKAIVPGESARVHFEVHLTHDADAHILLDADSRALMRTVSLENSAVENLLVAVVDGTGKIIGRSVDEDNYIGRPVPTWEALVAVGKTQGAFNALAFDGTPISFGFATVEGTPGWVVVVGMPKAIFDARWQKPISAFIFGTAIALVAAVALGLWLSQRISKPISVIVARAQANASNRQDPLPAAPDPIVEELDTLFKAQASSQARLAARAAELALSNQRFQAVAKVGAMVTWRTDTNANALEIDGWEAFTGQPVSGALGRGWMKRVHPDDLPELMKEMTQKTVPGGSVSVEIRIRTDFAWVWVNLRGAIAVDAYDKPVEWVGTLVNIDERKRLQVRISHLAYHDGLTGLPNRIRLADHFTGLWSNELKGTRGALLYIDLDKFKEANDQHGHAVGDELLKQVAARLGNVLRGGDLAARLGGDEFAIVLADLENDDYSILVAGRIVKTLSQPFVINGTMVQIGASVGIALFNAGMVSIERLQFEADSALYRAKSEGRNRWAFHQSESDEVANLA